MQMQMQMHTPPPFEEHLDHHLYVVVVLPRHQASAYDKEFFDP